MSPHRMTPAQASAGWLAIVAMTVGGFGMLVWQVRSNQSQHDASRADRAEIHRQVAAAGEQRAILRKEQAGLKAGQAEMIEALRRIEGKVDAMGGDSGEGGGSGSGVPPSPGSPGTPGGTPGGPTP